MIYRIDPTDTPFMTGVEKARQPPSTMNGRPRRSPRRHERPARRRRSHHRCDHADRSLGNICQISYKVPQVTGTQQAVEHAGRDNEMAYQEMLKGLELKRDMETILVGTNQAKVTGASTTPRLTASILSWIKPTPPRAAPARRPIRRG